MTKRLFFAPSFFFFKTPREDNDAPNAPPPPSEPNIPPPAYNEPSAPFESDDEYNVLKKPEYENDMIIKGQPEGQ